MTRVDSLNAGSPLDPRSGMTPTLSCRSPKHRETASSIGGSPRLSFSVTVARCTPMTYKHF